jgi:hypothetical protein
MSGKGRLNIRFGKVDLTITHSYTLNGQNYEEEHKLDGLELQNGKKIPAQFINWIMGQIEPNGTAEQEAPLRALVRRGMPGDLPCWILTIDGEGIGQPEFIFQYTGVRIPDTLARPDAISPKPYSIECLTTNSDKVDYLLIGYIWQSRAVLKEFKSFCVETYDPRNAQNEPHDIRQFYLHTWIDPLTPEYLRGAALRKLAQGYDLMVDLLASLRKHSKYTAQEAEELADRIIEEARPFIVRWVRQKDRKGKKGQRRVRRAVSFESVASAIKKGKQTLYDIEDALHITRQRGLMDRLKEIEQLEREQAKEDEQKILNRLRPSYKTLKDA